MGVMTPGDFLAALNAILDKTDNALTMETSLASVPEWDSINVVTFIVLCDGKLGVLLSPDKISKCKNVADLYQLATTTKSTVSEPGAGTK